MTEWKRGWSGRFGPGEPTKIRPYSYWETGAKPDVPLTGNKPAPRYRVERPEPPVDKLSKPGQASVEALRLSHRINRAMSNLFDVPMYDAATNLRLPKWQGNGAKRIAQIFDVRRPAAQALKKLEEVKEQAVTDATSVPYVPTKGGAQTCIRPEIGKRGRAERYAIPQDGAPTEIVARRRGTNLVRAAKPVSQPTTPILTSPAR